MYTNITTFLLSIFYCSIDGLRKQDKNVTKRWGGWLISLEDARGRMVLVVKFVCKDSCFFEQILS